MESTPRTVTNDAPHPITTGANSGTGECPFLNGTLASNGSTTASNGKTEQCPFLSGHASCEYRHGSVTCEVYPGYVHGTNPEICPKGCKPNPPGTPLPDLLQLAMEYQELYHHERKTPEAAKQERMREVRDDIARTGTYTHTFDELEHGARLAWRNAPKCANRKFWDQLQLIDQRHVQTNDDMFAACKSVCKLCAVLSGIHQEKRQLCLSPPAPYHLGRL